MRSTESGFNEEVYLAAAREHLNAMNALIDLSSQEVLAFYTAGLAVECVFRAYAEMLGAEHDARHDLRIQAEKAQFISLMPPDQQEEARIALGEVVTRWRNNHRYRSITALRNFLNAEGLYRLSGGRTIRGDVVKYNLQVIADAATLLVTLGVARWETSKKKSRLS